MRKFHLYIDKFLYFSLLISLSLILQSCPSTLVQVVDKMKDKNDNLKAKRNYYRLQNRDIRSVEQLKSDYQLNIDANSLKELINHDKFPFRLEITNVNANNYPDEIEFNCTVYDTLGRFIGGLAPPYFNNDYDYRKHWFSLFDSCNNENTKIDNFEIEEIRDNKNIPYSIMFALDHSPSMGNDRALKLQQAIHKVMYAIKKNDRIGVVKFTKDIYYEVKLTSSPTKYRNEFQLDSLDRKKYTGGTAIYDAIDFSINELIKIKDNSKKIIILFSDGQDNSSELKMDSILKSARLNKISIYSIAYGYADSTIEDISYYTGGKFYQILSSKEFPYVFKDIYTLLNNYYLIKYKPKDCPSKHYIDLNLDLILNGSPQLKGYATYDKSILNDLDLPGKIVMLNIEFDLGSYNVKEGSMPQLNDIAKSLKNNKKLRILISGHTDDIGTDEANLKLSEQRANQVKELLISMGIDGNRIETKGYGESKPIVPNDSDENRKKNRRTEFEVIK